MNAKFFSLLFALFLLISFFLPKNLQVQAVELRGACEDVLIESDLCLAPDKIRPVVAEFLNLYNESACLDYMSVAEFVKLNEEKVLSGDQSFYTRLLDQVGVCGGFRGYAVTHLTLECQCEVTQSFTNTIPQKILQQQFVEILNDPENAVVISGTPIIAPTNVPQPTIIIPVPTTDKTPTEFFIETEGEIQRYGDNCGLAGEEGKDSCCVNRVPTVHWNAPSYFSQFVEFGENAVNFVVKRVNLFTQTSTLTMYNVYESVGGENTSNPFCYTGKPSSFKNGQDPFSDLNCKCEDPNIGSGGKYNEAICGAIKNTNENKECVSCFTGGKGVWTALGCIETDFSTFITKTVFGTGIGIAGLIALLCIIYSAFLMQTSQGNPEQITKAQEMLTSCITGLIMIIFSILILRFIGVDLLRIPGFSNTSEVAKDDPDIITKVSLASSTPIITPGTTAAPATTLPPSPTLTRTPITVLTNIPTPLVTSATTLTPTKSPTFTPIPTPTTARPDLGEFDCDTNTNEPLANEVYLYDKLNYSGACLRLTAGSYGLRATSNASTPQSTWNLTKRNWGGNCLVSFNDCVSSFKVGSDVHVILYQHPRAEDIPESGGCTISTEKNINNLSQVGSDNCNNTFITDKISYVSVELK